MVAAHGTDRVFLFLQGPHGPFFSGLARMLRRAGAQTWRVGFNAGDQRFWFDRDSYIPFQDSQDNWPDTCADIMAGKKVTDLVVYGDARPIHAQAIAAAKQRGITVHVFEEGYIRPYWVTYEHDGSNGNSRLMGMSIDEIRNRLGELETDIPMPPAHWGRLAPHIFYGALYHWAVLFRNRNYPGFRPHREYPVAEELKLYLRGIVALPYQSLERRLVTHRVRASGYPYHVALLQLEHDSAFQHHSPFSKMAEFLDLVVKGFAEGAPPHHHLVVKAHPLEDGRAPIRKIVKGLTREYNLKGRVHLVGGSKLAPLLNDARSAVTINSTAGQQVLWRGLPLKIFGDAIYGKPDFISPQPLPDFFANPQPPNTTAYRDFRQFLLHTSQVFGGFYALSGRRRLYQRVVDMMLSAKDPYDLSLSPTAAQRQQLRLVTKP